MYAFNIKLSIFPSVLPYLIFQTLVSQNVINTKTGNAEQVIDFSRPNIHKRGTEKGLTNLKTTQFLERWETPKFSLRH
jgi:hypothetical protein